MMSAVVSAEIAAIHQGARKGVHQVMFMELYDGTWAAPQEMVDLIPTAFPEYTIRMVSDSEYKPITVPGSEI